jgi:hypothetical protein
MVTLKGKDADRFIRKMIKKENSPISKKDKKLARDVKETMSKLHVVESYEDRRRREIEEKYNPTIKKIDDGLCQRCRKNKATINYTDSIMSYTHGFVEHICKSCYDKIKKSNIWYKAGRKEMLKEVKKMIDKMDFKLLIQPNDDFWIKNKIKQGLKELEDKEKNENQKTKP